MAFVFDHGATKWFHQISSGIQHLGKISDLTTAHLCKRKDKSIKRRTWEIKKQHSHMAHGHVDKLLAKVKQS
jgi:hypothetical protein